VSGTCIQGSDGIGPYMGRDQQQTWSRTITRPHCNFRLLY